MDPCWQSEAFFEQQKKQGEEMSGLVPHPPTPLLPDAMCSAIAEALDIDDCKIQLIHCALYNLMLRRKIARLSASKISEAFSTLHRISRKLTEGAEELRQASYDVGQLLDLACTSRGKRGMTSGLQLLTDPLMPKDRDWWMAHLEERSEETYEDDALAMIEAVRRPIAMLLELEPKRPRGSPGREFRNSVIRDLAKVYTDTLDEAPTCTPNGRFMLLCQLVFDALEVDSKGLENAVGRVLRSLNRD